MPSLDMSGIYAVCKKIPALFRTPISTSKVRGVSSLSCDLNDQRLLFLETEKTPEGLRILKTAEIDGFKPGEEGIKKLVAVSDQQKFSSKRVRLVVKGSGVVVRFIQFPKMRLEDLKSAISFEAEKYIPFKAEEVIFDYSVLDPDITMSSGTKGMNLLLVAAKRDEICPVVQAFSAAQYEVELVCMNALSYLNGLEYFYPDDFSKCLGALEIGTTISTFAIAREKKPRLIRDVSFGLADLQKKLKRILGVVDDRDMRELLLGTKSSTPGFEEALKESCKNLVSDIKISLDYYLNQAQSPEPPSKIFAAGEGACFPVLIKTLSEMMGVPFEMVDCSTKVQAADAASADWLKKNRSYLPVILGLAVRTV